MVDGDPENAVAISVPAGENATPEQSNPGSVAGFAYFVPKPEALHGYAKINGETPQPIAI
jgi:hypothetical protein